MIEKNEYTKKYGYIFLSLVIAYLLISPEDITWAQDRVNYLTYTTSSNILIERYMNRGIISLLSNEPLFLLINIVLGGLFSPETVLKIIIFTSTYLAVYSLGYLSKYNYWILVLFLISPTILLKYTVHLRQGLAMSIYFLGFVGYSKNNSWKNMRFLAPFIHTSMIFVVLIEIFIQIHQKYNLGRKLRFFLFTLIMFPTINILPKVAYFLGDRRSIEYTFSLGLTGSGIGLLFWTLLGIYFIKYRDENYISEICDYGIIIYIASYLYLPFAARIFESIFPLIVLSVVRGKKNMFRLIFIFILIIYGLIIGIVT